MRIVDIREAETHLSRLIDKAAKGEPFIIARSGKPIVKSRRNEGSGSRRTRRVGFMAGQFSVPDDFDRMGGDRIETLFGGGA
ncbi:type II toxin-antitoxin system Phd/YefM family antitoxin [Mesorhizobium retamae]|uniref:Antitoxin n=1 Tax=Mesorhizobium retamae TaxID=2912854 RepID=A0ABS9QIA3_9HYPH|nr:type II toxin-antitoxin system Phd/YefM family antitoxin [Mesorhizobium sp. IRAMC:0171]MCG7507146.1 type II toxin-antitoxin system Phd/YefM family antitoxin [Mesorhizobium sp. IRAMC:0171]